MVRPVDVPRGGGSTRRRTEVRRLERAIARDPENGRARGVYTDWLTARGDPLGDLLLTEAEWARTEDQRLLARLARLRRTCAGDLDQRSDLVATWRAGLVHRLEVREPSAAARDLRSVLARPALRALGVVAIRPPTRGRSSLPQPFVDELGRCAPPTVHTLELSYLQRSRDAPRVLARLAPLASLPAFDTVGLELAAGQRVHLPRDRLVGFSLVVREVSFVERLEAQTWPRLERLELAASPRATTEVGLALGERVLRALTHLRAPRLGEVLLRGFELPHAALAALLRSRSGRRLRALDLTDCTVELRRLRRLATREPHVRRVLRRRSDRPRDGGRG